MDMVRNKKETALIHTLIAFVFLMDETLLPVFHLVGIPFKISYVFLLLSLGFYIFSVRVNDDLHFKFEAGSEAKKIVCLLFGLIFLSFLGEMTMMLFSNVTNGQTIFLASLPASNLKCRSSFTLTEKI